jgi:hypothetical protein
MHDALRLAGDAAAILETRGFVACARKKNDLVTLDCWSQGSGRGYSFALEPSDLSAEALATRVAVELDIRLGNTQSGHDA